MDHNRFSMTAMRSLVWTSVWLFMGLLGAACALGEDQALDHQAVEFFESRIRPILAEHCYECHSAESKIVRGGLQLDSRDAVLKGGDSGPALIQGNPEESLLVQALKHEAMEMPPRSKLADSVISDFEQWIRDGAVDPRDEVRSAGLQPIDWEQAKNHWAFQPIRRPPVPTVEPDDWSRSPIDRFVLQGLRDHEVHPAAQAEKRTLIRRATFDLTGLPPTPAEVDAFVADESETAFVTLIDRLLESPRYGERWGRHWLDLVRYATTNGADENHALPNAWRYRDWVIRKVNEDLPLDQFIVQQIAGDLLPAPEDESIAGDLITATGMLVIGPKMLAEQDKDKMMIDIVDEQIDTISRTMLGITIGCARCHDHKFDPIATRDYYSLAGIFASTKTMADRSFVSNWMERPLPSSEVAAKREMHQTRIDEVKAELNKLETSGDDELIKQKKSQLEQLEKQMPAFEMVMAVDEGTPHDLPVHIRGNHLRPTDEVVPRGMPAILTNVISPPPIASDESGRLQFAQWLVSDQNPLTARVMANRIWMWHFGKPLMRTPSNWGLQAETPTHPALLDWLADELIRSGWSLKAMHRTIMLSSTYQMSSEGLVEYAERDPENRWLSKQNRRRLEAEPIRDSILFIGQGLDETMGSMAPATHSNRRAIYLPIDRAALYEMFSSFDYVETASHIEQRPVTTVPNQALFLMNSSLVHEQSRRLVERLQLAAITFDSPSIGTGIELLFEHLYARPPKDDEVERTQQFLMEAERLMAGTPDATQRRRMAWTALCRTLMAGNEFIYVE